MNIIDYLNTYKEKTFKKVPFNELDALIMALMSYFPFDLIKKKRIKSSDVIEFLKTYDPPRKIERKLLDIVVLNTICSSKRYRGIKFLDFEKRMSNETIEQFQAVTIDFKDFMFVSFCGTNATIVGWREDMNMSFLEIVPSEIDASRYINAIRKKHPFKPIYIGGHSKGGRLAVRAGKEIYKNNNLKAIFSFDGPNFTDSFYDSRYDEMKELIYEYAPNESIIGRLIKDTKKIIVKSSASMIWQHDAYTWLVEDDHFVHTTRYTDTSNKIAEVMGELFNTLDVETKSVVINTLFDVIEKLDFHSFKKGESRIETVKRIMSEIKIGWKSVSKENRKVVLNVVFTIILIIIQTRKPTHLKLAEKNTG